MLRAIWDDLERIQGRGCLVEVRRETHRLNPTPNPSPSPTPTLNPTPNLSPSPSHNPKVRLETHRSGAPGEAVVATFVSDKDYCDVGTKLMSGGAQGRYTVLGRTVRALPLAALP